MTMILHCGGQAKSLNELALITVPEHTQSYRPIPYANAITLVLEQMKLQHGLLPAREAYGTNKDGMQLFAKIDYNMDSDTQRLSIGLRGAYDKSLCWMFGGGGSVMVCDNLCFSADGFVVMRKNTTFAWRDYQRLVVEHVATLVNRFEDSQNTAKVLASKPCNQIRGYELLGVAQGHGLLSPRQASVAFTDWTTPRHPEFEARNLWSLLNCMTEGLKKGNLGNTISRHAAATKYVEAECQLVNSTPKF
jgi:hypothetical protein